MTECAAVSPGALKLRVSLIFSTFVLIDFFIDFALDFMNLTTFFILLISVLVTTIPSFKGKYP